MNKFQKDKIIKSKIYSNDEIPENIENIFDKFIEENIIVNQSKK